MGAVLSTLNKAQPGNELREFHYTQADFERVRKLLYARAGISLSETKDQMVYSRLARRLRALGLNRFDEYFAHLQQHDEEWQQFINALTTNLTAFFREAHHFQMLEMHIRSLNLRDRPLRIWCSAASTGEEPYSIAMSVMKAMGSLTPKVEILASDIDTSVLTTGSLGIYQESKVAGLDTQLLQRFFLRGKGSQRGRVKVRPEVQALIDFRQINLLDDQWDIPGGLDVIFCRNVMIYFDKATQTRLLERMVRLLRPDGLFFAGHSESFVQATSIVKLVERTVYRPVFRGH
jgi:chemotaxis protein methyltransferase CheR